ncbi:MAG: histidinol dehydrogenase [Euryarchaeota archaeon]|nr:histidinol dehydrogenase [Euryarchaeota archaeon]
MKIVSPRDLDDRFFTYEEPAGLSRVREILRDVRKRGDTAVKEYTKKFDGVSLDKLKIEKNEIERAYKCTDKEVIVAMNTAAENIEKFAMKQLSQFTDFEEEIVSGATAGQRVVPIERVGIYVPGGKFPLISSVLMCAVPAKLAGVKEILICSPPAYKGSIHNAVLAAASIVGVEEVYAVGGAQAIGAMAYGTETISRVDKIVGPGNTYVTSAKKEVFGEVGIDFIAGPTELMIIADKTADPAVITADLLAQAEHDKDALPILVTPSSELAEDVTQMIKEQEIENGGLSILVKSLDDAIGIANKKAPEHMELQVKNAEKYAKKLRNYGSLFIGTYSSEVLGDYSSGLNHTLPTNTSARYTGGLSVMDFLKLQTTLRVTKEGGRKIGLTAKVLAETEGLQGHVRSVDVREKVP